MLLHGCGLPLLDALPDRVFQPILVLQVFDLLRTTWICMALWVGQQPLVLLELIEVQLVLLGQVLGHAVLAFVHYAVVASVQVQGLHQASSQVSSATSVPVYSVISRTGSSIH